MVTLMSGSAVRLPRTLPAWLRVGRRSPREIWPQLLVVVLGALLIWQCVRLLWVLLTPLSPLGAWQPQAAVIASPAERRALFSSFDPFFRGNVQGPASATVTALDDWTSAVTTSPENKPRRRVQNWRCCPSIFA